MRLKLSIFAFVAGTTFATNIQRVCSPANGRVEPYTGFRVDIQLSFNLKQEFHLYMCKEGRATMDLVIPQSSTVRVDSEEPNIIPWGQEICNNKSSPTICYTLARRRSFKLRTLPIYFPGTVVGGVFEGDTPVLPLVAEDFWSNQWLEIKGLRKSVYHFPILSSPPFEHSKHPGTNRPHLMGTSKLWAKNILRNEKYLINDSDDTRFLFRKGIDTIFEKINILSSLKKLSLMGAWGTEGNRFNPFFKFLLLSKVLSKEVFYGLVNDIDKVYNRLNFN
ncbi:hypothetical protein CLIB1423_12S01376 [[Candida] railenensis]|uniref:Uncharacterized protein n=1 Tax=[Candida] railenensis TaxID=45579 RepID=A0A9P0QRP0_9ASCO|nr:hypothetical protein CLIB1423_12S01376 [[Candida] railenensis]